VRSSPYLAYVRAFTSELHQVPVWEPGSLTEVGQYGIARKKRWEPLGSIWDILSPDSAARVREAVAVDLGDLQMGLAAVSSLGGEGSAALPQLGVAGGVRIKFSRDRTLCLLAYRCRTESLKNRQLLGEVLGGAQEWDHRWLVTSSVTTAERFTVVASSAPGREVELVARSPEVFELVGSAELNLDSKSQGQTDLAFLNRSGAIYMGLDRVRGPGLFRKDLIRREYLANETADDDVWVEPVEPTAFLEHVLTDGP
jgi:hypothetical protein